MRTYDCWACLMLAAQSWPFTWIIFRMSLDLLKYFHHFTDANGDEKKEIVFWLEKSWAKLCVSVCVYVCMYESLWFWALEQYLCSCIRIKSSWICCIWIMFSAPAMGPLIRKDWYSQCIGYVAESGKLRHRPPCIFIPNKCIH